MTKKVQKVIKKHLGNCLGTACKGTLSCHYLRNSNERSDYMNSANCSLSRGNLLELESSDSGNECSLYVYSSRIFCNKRLRDNRQCRGRGNR